MRLFFFDAKAHYDTDPVRGLMWLALPYPNDEMVDKLLRRYHDDDQMYLFGALDEEESLQGLIGLKSDGPTAGTILHLRVQDDAIGHGVGTALVRKAIALLKLETLNGRAAEPMLPFYTKLGFTSWVVGEKPPGTKWYGVTWKKEAEPG